MAQITPPSYSGLKPGTPLLTSPTATAGIEGTHEHTHCPPGISPPCESRIAHRHRPTAAPRGAKAQFSKQNWYDVWFPNLAPSLPTMKLGLAAMSPAQWAAFARKYRAEMAAPATRHDLAPLAALSQTTNFSVGCYCEDEQRCHRSILKQLLIASGARIA